ncbi:MAG: hypothetical protein AB1439_10445 [candidate division FCPU426 bacterium]
MADYPELAANLETLIDHLTELQELEEARQVQTPDELAATLPAYLTAKQAMLDRVSQLTQNGWLAAAEERLGRLEPADTAAYFQTLWDRMKALLEDVRRLHDENLNTLKHHSEELGKTVQALGKTLNYLRAYPLNPQQSVRVNILG